MSDNQRQGKGVGYVDDFGKACMIRCFECGKENYAPAVTSGMCAWCGYDANKPLPDPTAAGGKGKENG